MDKDKAIEVVTDRVGMWLENEFEYIGSEIGRFAQHDPKAALEECDNDEHRWTLEQYLETLEAFETLTGKHESEPQGTP